MVPANMFVLRQATRGRAERTERGHLALENLAESAQR